MPQNMKENKKKLLKRKQKQLQKKQIVLDYFPRGNIFCNQESTQIQKKSVENDFIFNQSLYTFQSKPQNKGNGSQVAIKENPLLRIKQRSVLTYDKDQEENYKELDEPVGQFVTKNLSSKQVSSGKKDVSKIPRIVFEKGNFCMMAVCQINKYYMIANYTRNKKAYVNQANASVFMIYPFQLTFQGQLLEDYKIGDLIFATIIQGSDKIIKRDSEQIIDVSHKYQLTVNPLTYNFGFSIQNLVPGVALMGVISLIEQSGCYIELGFKDELKGFIKSSNLGQQIASLKEGKPINLVISKISKKSKVVSCLPIASSMGKSIEIENDKVSFDALRPGSRVKCRVVEKYQNGITVKFLKHFTGSIFIDHLQKNPRSYKKDQEIYSRIIAVKQSSKLIALSNLPHILQFQQCQVVQHGIKLQDAKVQQIAAESLILSFKNTKSNAIMHVSHLNLLIDIQRTNIPPQLLQKVQTGFIFPQVFLKQFNYFDNTVIARPSTNKQSSKQFISIQSLKIGQIINVQIIGVSSN